MFSPAMAFAVIPSGVSVKAPHPDQVFDCIFEFDTIFCFMSRTPVVLEEFALVRPRGLP
ncbi:hypothetical protein A2U01_0101613 [Trifolium medium]|uniref:Uncharacterized protein n=1 Tax=Trifolium medium TaxID=97028 RepID=A0A392UYX8_9FABA|nr:hypothetical protein [Trifolium medium]